MSNKFENSTEHIDVKVPIQSCYAQWTQFEDFPKFMGGVEEVKQTSDETTHWKTSIAGKKEEFDATITEQIPQERIAWNSTSGPNHAGVVTFHKLDDATTRVTLQMDYSPEGIIEKVGSKIGVVDSRVKNYLASFAQFITERDGEPTGSWTGSVERS